MKRGDESVPATTRTFALSGWGSIYASDHSLYITQTHYTYVCYGETDYVDDTIYEPSTLFIRFEIDGLDVKFHSTFKATGYLLNQFSMSEYDGYFRTATTTGWGQEALNNVYLFDVTSNAHKSVLVGKLEGLAPGETLKSVRFVKDRGYLVTFVQTDPLFVLDLSDPTTPTVLGELIIPGYSTYLHPVNTTHTVGFGVDTHQDEHGNIRQAGMKLSLFNTEDEFNPTEQYNIVFGATGSYSDAMFEHRAFQYWFGANDGTSSSVPGGLVGQEGIVAFPIMLAKPPSEGEWQGPYVFQGVSLFRVSFDKFSWIANITHHDTSDFTPIYVEEWDYYTFPYYTELVQASDIMRVFRRGSYVFTVSANKILVSGLNEDQTAVTDLGSVSLNVTWTTVA